MLGDGPLAGRACVGRRREQRRHQQRRDRGHGSGRRWREREPGGHGEPVRRVRGRPGGAARAEPVRGRPGACPRGAEPASERLGRAGGHHRRGLVAGNALHQGGVSGPAGRPARYPQRDEAAVARRDARGDRHARVRQHRRHLRGRPDAARAAGEDPRAGDRGALGAHRRQLPGERVRGRDGAARQAHQARARPECRRRGRRRRRRGRGRGAGGQDLRRRAPAGGRRAHAELVDGADRRGAAGSFATAGRARRG
mmetsp:Transcript_15347/g.63740  ORF Transcript_15347/g.63740 Transcript_15347/m.63740 type:complete len:254 (+) Transcript_15347:1096-1857(+)